jgi:hypothetical protein
MEELLQQTAIKVEHLQGVYNAAVSNKDAWENLRKFELPAILERQL